MTLETQRALPNEPDLQTIQTQIQERGSFCPVQWLIDTGLLPYPGYEAWRYGEHDFLTQAVECETGTLLALLQAGQRQAQALKLVSESTRYHDWRAEQSERELAFSRRAELSQLLSTRWLRSQDLPQLDLFMDSGTASAENGLIDTLCGRQWHEAEKAYSTLCEIAPNHNQLGRFETLVLYGKHMAANPVIESEWVADELAGLEQDIAPVARELLRGRARDYLALAWQRLGHSLAASREPHIHPSYAWMQIPDWQQVIDSIANITDYREQPELLGRLAQALYYRGQQDIAMLAAASVFELDVDSSSLMAVASSIGPLNTQWQEFSDSDEPHPSTHFPAWLLLRRPGLIHHLNSPYPKPAGKAFQACVSLLHCRVEKRDEINAREHLQGISPGLLRVYLGAD